MFVICKDKSPRFAVTASICSSLFLYLVLVFVFMRFGIFRYWIYGWLMILLGKLKAS